MPLSGSATWRWVRSPEALVEAIGQALGAVTASAARGWFAHCGYPPDDNHLDFFAARYLYVRGFALRFISAFGFRSNRPDDPLLAAVEELRELNEEGKRTVPEDAPSGVRAREVGPARGRCERPGKETPLGIAPARTTGRPQVRRHVGGGRPTLPTRRAS